MADLALFEKFVRTQISSVAVNRAPTEEELTAACNMVRLMMPITDEEVEIIIKKLQAALDVAMDTGIVIEKNMSHGSKQKRLNRLFLLDSVCTLSGTRCYENIRCYRGNR